jgi:hypothetical protein
MTNQPEWRMTEQEKLLARQEEVLKLLQSLALANDEPADWHDAQHTPEEPDDWHDDPSDWNDAALTAGERN